MQEAKVLSSKEVREIIAAHFGVDDEDVIQSKYSYIVIERKDGEK